MPALRRYARKLGGGADLGDDLLQETLSRALACEAAYRTQGAMTAWLCQILKNIARDQHKSNRKRSQRFPLFSDLASETTDENSDGDAGDYDSTIADATTFCERERQLDAKILIELAPKVLGPEMWKCLELTTMGFSSEEIASQLGISAAAVRQNVSRGRRAIEALRADTEKSASKPSRKKTR